MSTAGTKHREAADPVPAEPSRRPADVRGAPAGSGCSVSFRVRYYETDTMGVTHHSNYLRWFEVARTEYLREAGMAYRRLEEIGLGCPLTGARCRYLQASRYDDLVTVKTWIRSYNGVRLTMAYTVTCNGQLLCDGETDHAFVKDGKPVALSRSMPAIHAGMLECLDRDTRPEPADG
jgi:acyl-CoA thioester hydrolase